MIAAKAAVATLQEPNTPLLRALMPESEILERISEAFARMLAFKELDVHSYFEELPMGKFGKVSTCDVLLPDQPSFCWVQ